MNQKERCNALIWSLLGGRSEYVDTPAGYQGPEYTADYAELEQNLHLVRRKITDALCKKNSRIDELRHCVATAIAIAEAESMLPGKTLIAEWKRAIADTTEERHETR